MRKQWLLTFFVLIGFVLPLAAQNRGGDLEDRAIDIVDAQGEIAGRFTEAHALVIGESEYNNGWRRLPGVKTDLTAVKRLFEEQGFNVVTIEDANSQNLRNGITNFLDNYAYNPNARIVLYYAGHGSTVDLGGRRMGYIVPVDAPPESNNRDFLQTAIPMTQFETWAKQYTSRHILFIFDSCFAGTVFRSQGTVPPAISRLVSQPVRQFITSGDADEEVPDESIFRRELEYALRNSAADLNNDGYVSGTELGLYLFNSVSNYMNGRQNPRIGKLNDANLDKGDFIFAVSSGGSSGAFVQQLSTPVQPSTPAQVVNPTVTTPSPVVIETAPVIILQPVDPNGVALVTAAMNQDEAALRQFLRRGANINYVYNERTALMEACNKNWLTGVRILLDAGANADYVNAYQMTALMFAARTNNNNLNIVRLLENRNVLINARDEHNKTALMYAIESQNDQMVDFLINKGANLSIRNTYNQDALIIAARNNYQYGVIQLLTKGDGINFTQVDNYGKTAFIYACEWENFQLIRLLKEKGVNELAANANGLPPLLWLIQFKKSYTVIEYLVRNTQAIASRDSNGKDAIWYLNEYDRNNTRLRQLLENR